MGDWPRNALFCRLVLAAVLISSPHAHLAAQDRTSANNASDLALIRQVDKDAAGFESATAASLRLSGQPSAAAVDVLSAMKGASALAKNWLRTIAADVADNDSFPREQLLQFFADREQDSDARHAAFQMLIASDASLKGTLLEGAVDDPSLPVRHAAIELVLSKAAKLVEQNDAPRAIEVFRVVIAQGRNPEQLQSAVSSLEKLGQKVDLAEELGMVRRWWVIGTFENTGSASFDTVYEPESTYLANGKLPSHWLQMDAEVGKANSVSKSAISKLVTSEDAMGMVNINPAFGNAKDAIAYGYVELEIPEGVEAVARLGCITANKVWVNGKLALANEVYHSGTRIDQYLGDCVLMPGKNTVLVKICQNAQTEPWAQDWQFQFRLTDRLGTAIKPASILQPGL